MTDDFNAAMNQGEQAENDPLSNGWSEFDLAIVGMAGRFPGSPDLDAFWRNLVDGVECVRRFTDEEVAAAGVDPALSSQPHYVKAGGVLEGAEWFDAHFFGVYPREAEIMDPQHRVFLEVAWHALEHAGYDPATSESTGAGAIGVYAGCGLNTYLIYNLAQNREIRENVQGYQLTIANDKDYLPSRVAYKLNLRGPAVNVQTACSTSLVATHLACQALLSHDCDMALAGGVTVRLPQQGGYLYQEGGIMSPDGHCRAFDAQAAGTVGGNGVGIVVLKRLSDALADGDTIHAVIKGTAINNDGSNKVGYTAPSVEGQTGVISAAHAVANVDPSTISYVETHGTGTALGDPIEITALTNAFGLAAGPDDLPAQTCAIGSLKPNVGHLDAAAGIAGLIKTTLALENGQIPPSINFSAPNPQIDFAKSPFYVNDRLSEWRSTGGHRRAGVSSFGIGGTNAHVVLEEAPPPAPAGASRAAQLLVVSAKTEAALDAATANLAQFLADRPAVNLADAAYTLQVGRQPFAYRRVAVVRDLADACVVLEGRAPGRLVGNGGAAGATSVAFMFTGQGSQYAGMGLGLYKAEPVFRDAVDRCADILRPHLATDIRGLIYPRVADGADERLKQTAMTQPALFVVEYALAQLWLAWGVRPGAMIGHSIGEYVAAHLAGVMSLDDALMIVAARGRLMGSLPGGSMLGLPLGEEDAHALLVRHPRLAVATINAPGMVVVAGPDEAVESLEQELAGKKIATRRLHTSHAFHSAMMDPILAPFADVVRRARLSAPATPYVSNVTGTWITAADATDPAYYARHLRGAVRFADGLAALAAEPNRAFLEVGPGPTLAGLAKAHPAVGRERRVVTSLRHPREAADDLEFMLGALGQLWLGGIVPRWDAAEERDGAPWVAFYGGQNRHERRRRIPLPLYPFQRERFWVEPDTKLGAPATDESRAAKTADIAGWFYVPSWRRIPMPPRSDASGWQVLVFALGHEALGHEALGDEALMDEALADEAHEGTVQLLAARACGRPVVVRPGRGFAEGADGFTVEPGAVEQYEALFRALEAEGRLPQSILHLWSAGQGQDESAVQSHGFDSLVALARAWGTVAGSAEVQVDVVTRGIYSVTGDEPTTPAAAMILGAARVIGQETPGIKVRVVDLAAGEENAAWLADVAFTEHRQQVVALRGRHCWAQGFERLETGSPAGGSSRLRQQGVYLITGGLGRIGLVLAAHLASSVQARLVLVDRIALPERDAWPRLLADGDPGEDPAAGPAAALRARLQKVLAIEAAGGAVLSLQADVADSAQMAAAVDETISRFGALHGVIHAAGTVGQAAIRSISETDAAVREAQLGPKAGGAYALAQALGAHGGELDFVILMSSVSTVLGGLGFAAYAGANSVLEAFALEQARAGHPWLSVAWDGWAFAEERALGAAAAGALAFAITPEEGVAVFDRLLSVVDQGAVVVSTGDLNLRLVRAQAGETRPKPAAGGTEKPSGKYARPHMRTAYVEPSDDVERAIAADWEGILGISPVGVHDDFFELGGHSLLATQLVSRLRDAYHVELPLRNLFETPTIAGLAAAIRRAQGAGAGAAEGPAGPSAREAILPLPRDGELPLSFGQERLWFLDQLAPGSALYNNFAALRLNPTGEGAPLDPARLEWALNQVIARHEVLRTVFGERDGKPTQTILPAIPVSVPVIDVATMEDPQGAGQRVEDLAREEARAPFDLGKGPLLRAKLLRTGADEYVLFFTMHHIVSDGWSVGVLIQEVVRFYESGGDTVLAPLPIQYGDYAAWQREWLGRVREEQLAYWRGRLTPEPEPLELATDRPRPAVQTSNGANYWFSVAPRTHRKLEALAQGEGATLFMALLAGLQALLHRYTGQEDICVGTPVANRDRSETEGLIGFLLNTLVLRTDLSPAPGAAGVSFRELLGRVREVALGTYAHQDLPFESLVEGALHGGLQPARDMSRSPYFQVMFDLQAAPLAGITLPGMSLAPLRVDGGTAKFDLALSLEYGPSDDGGALGGYLNYNSDLFDAETVVAMVEHLNLLLADAVDRPDAAISELALISAAESRRLLVEWADGGLSTQPLGAGQTVVSMFEEQARLRPLQPAVVMADGSGATLTYAALNERANKMARCMAESGIGHKPDQIVALLLHRSVDMIAAIWAVLKAGAAFVPIDPGNPPERIAFMLADSGAAALITDGPADMAALPQHVFQVDADGARFAGQPGRDLGLRLPGSALAYVIYTSGSTGHPKGVLIEHGGLAQHIVDVTARFGLRPGDHILQFAAYTFDQGLEQVLTALTVGGTLVVRGDEVWPPAEFPQVLAGYGLNVVNLPPAYWNQVLLEWVASEPTNKLPKRQLRTVISGGDVLTPESLRLWSQVQATTGLAGEGAPGVRLINAYGPTETTVTACAFDVPGDWFARSSRPVPVGRPLPNRLAYVVDRHGRPTPAGVPGELWLGGNGVAREYLNRDELTAEKFVENPFIQVMTGRAPATARVYRTGDLVRYTRDGNLEFMGRIDQQVKVRGFRIELGEIEAALLEHPSVAAAVVVDRGDGGDKQLVAFYVAAASAPAPGVLRTFLGEKLPGYMVPAAFVALPTLPLTASGKVDRTPLRTATLPAPDDIDAGESYVAPRTPVETKIAAIWAGVLGAPRVGVNDNFFDLGGHSLLATQIVSRLRAHYPVDLPLRRLFESPTVAGLAGLVEEGLLAQQSEEDLAALLAELDGLSEEETRLLLDDAAAEQGNEA